MEPPGGSRPPDSPARLPRAGWPPERRAEHYNPGFYLLIPILIIVIVGLAGAAVALMLAPTVVGVNAGVQRISQRLKEEGATFRKLPRPPERSVIYANDGKTILATVYLDENREIVSLDDVDETAKDAVLAIEDHGFYEHAALNGESVLRALLTNLGSGTVVQGGSTITQQLVKNTLISKPRETYARKLQEAGLAIRMEQKYTKDQILELYLNEVYFGNGVYGLGTAALYYFNTPPSQLSLTQSATLAGMIAAPETYDPIHHPKASQRRRNVVLKAMDAYDFAGPKKVRRARKQPLHLSHGAGAQDSGPKPFIVTYVTRQILNDDTGTFDAFGRTEKQRIHTLYQGGLRITTTLDPGWQASAQRVAQAQLPDAKGTPDTSVVSIENSTGAVRTLLSGKNYARDQLNLAAATRQAGSAFKPFTLAAAFRQQISPKTTFESKSPLHLTQWDNACHCVQNAEPGGGGRIDLWQATEDSVNVVFAQLALKVGPSNIVTAAHDMGIESPLLAVPSITLGANDVSALEMAAAYQTLANQGEHCDPYMVARVQDSDGTLLYRHRPDCNQVISKEIANLITAMLERVVTGGTGQSAQLGARPVAGKTGTTQDSTDAWFVGYTPQVTTAVWVGLPGNPAPMEQWFGSSVFGGTVAAPIWSAYMLHVTNGMPVQGFPAPPANFGKKPPKPKPKHKPDIKVPDVVGLAAKDAQTRLENAGFLVTTNQVASQKSKGTVLSQSPGGGKKAKKGETVSLDVSSGHAPQVAVPGVVGKGSDAARTALRNAGFSVAVSLQEVGQDSKVGTVLSQSPGAGVKTRPGATVNITVGKKKPKN